MLVKWSYLEVLFADLDFPVVNLFLKGSDLGVKLLNQCLKFSCQCQTIIYNYWQLLMSNNDIQLLTAWWKGMHNPSLNTTCINVLICLQSLPSLFCYTIFHWLVNFHAHEKRSLSKVICLFLSIFASAFRILARWIILNLIVKKLHPM